MKKHQHPIQRRFATLFLALLLLVPFFPGSRLSAAEGFISREAAERDLAAFFDMVENSFPLTDVANRRGEGLEALKASVRIEDADLKNPRSYSAFYQKLMDRFCGPGLLGHFGLIAPGIEYDYYYGSELRFSRDAGEDPSESAWVRPFEHKKAKGFYSWKGRPEPDSDEEAELPEGDASGTALNNNVHWSIDKEHRAAIISVGAFEYVNIDADGDEIERFYQAAEAAKAEHLILDMRGNPGGVMQYWLKHFVQPNISEPLDSVAWGPFKSSHWTAEVEEEVAANWGPGPDSDDPDFPGITDTVEVCDSPIPGFSKAFKEVIHVEPLSDSPRFKGKIWLLVNEESYSSSETFAYFVKDTGFATLVGQTDGGDGVCCIPVYTNLPESGLIFRYDLSYGLNAEGTANAEFGTTPDMTVGEDDDALDLVLETIFETEKAKGVAGLSIEEKERDYEAFWEMLESSYPMLDKLREDGVDIVDIKNRYAQSFQGIQDKNSWHAFFQGIIDELTGGHELAHLSACGIGHTILVGDYEVYTYYKDFYPDDGYVTLLAPIYEDPHVQSFYGFTPTHREEGDTPYIDVPANVLTEMHPEQNWAYAKIKSFLNGNPNDGDILRQLFVDAEAAGIQHIILDIRGNLGGYNDYWLRKIISPNIAEPLKASNIGLFKNSPLNRHNLDYYAYDSEEEMLEQAIVDGGGEIPDMIFAWALLPGYKRPAMAKLDREATKNLDSSLTENIQIQPAGEKPIFSGDFYLLTDERSYSASEYFSSFCKRTGFATVVGRPTAGDGACVLTIYSPLPSSGLVIRFNMLYGLNLDGSSSEEQSTQPDLLIEPGEDALTRCLQLIAENEKAVP